MEVIGTVTIADNYVRSQHQDRPVIFRKMIT